MTHVLPALPVRRQGPSIPWGGVYAIQNTVNGRVYVGSTGNLRARMEHHRRNIRGGIWSNARLREDLRLYGADAFQFHVLQRTDDLNELSRLERAWAARLNAYDAEQGYNVQLIKLVRIAQVSRKIITPPVLSARTRLKRAQMIADRHA